MRARWRAAGGAVAAFADKFGDVHGLPVTVTDRKHTKAHGGAAATAEMDEPTYLFGHCCSIITDACAPCSAEENAAHSLLATADRDFKIRVARLPKDVATILDPAVGVPEIQSFCHGHAAFVACVAAVPAGEKRARAAIVSGGGDGAARLWRCEDGAHAPARSRSRRRGHALKAMRQLRQLRLLRTRVF